MTGPNIDPPSPVRPELPVPPALPESPEDLLFESTDRRTGRLPHLLRVLLLLSLLLRASVTSPSSLRPIETPLAAAPQGEATHRASSG
jgi:hypothetical protein